MDTAIILLLAAVLVLQVAQITRFSYFKEESCRRWNDLEAIFDSNYSGIAGKVSQIADAILQIADSKRLMEIIKLEGKEDLGINPEDFKAKKPELLKSMLEILNSEDERKRWRKDPDTFAYCILSHSGFTNFVANSGDLKKALARTLANRDYKATERTIRAMVRAL